MDWKVETEEKTTMIKRNGGRLGSTIARQWLLVILLERERVEGRVEEEVGYKIIR